MTKKKICKIDWCESPVRRRGFCNGHYTRYLKGTDMDEPFRLINNDKICNYEGCNEPAHSRFLCKKHYGLGYRMNSFSSLKKEKRSRPISVFDATINKFFRTSYHVE